MKPLLQSKTIWLAIIQGLIGGVVIALENSGIPDAVGYVAIVKSVGDIVLRLVTTSPIRGIS